MPAVTIRNLSNETHRALKRRATQHNRVGVLQHASVLTDACDGALGLFAGRKRAVLMGSPAYSLHGRYSWPARPRIAQGRYGLQWYGLLATMGIGGDWDNVAAGVDALWDALQSWATQITGNSAATSDYANFANGLVRGSTTTGAETINSPDGTAYQGDGTGGFGNDDTFSTPGSGNPSLFIRYEDSAVMHGGG